MHRPPTEHDVVELFLGAYSRGAFPMADPPSRTALHRDARAEGPIRWYAPDPRAILPLEDGALHVPRSLKRTLRRRPFTLTSDQAFERVIRACASPSDRRVGAWLNETLIRCYTLLHRHGHAHSIEAWTHDASPALVGGIYGVAIGRAFMAESMFCRPDLGGTDASKVCLVTLWHHLRDCGYELLDVQIANDHTERFGVIDIPQDEYLDLLARAIDHADAWTPLD